MSSRTQAVGCRWLPDQIVTIDRQDRGAAATRFPFFVPVRFGGGKNALQLQSCRNVYNQLLLCYNMSLRDVRPDQN